MAWLVPSIKQVRRMKKVGGLKQNISICWRAPDGTVRKQSTGTKDYAEARRLLAEFNEQADQYDRHLDENALFTTVANEYIRTLNLRPRSVKRYRALTETFTACAGERRMKEINAPLLGDFKSWCREEIPIRKATGELTTKNRYSDNTTAMVIVFIKAVFKYAHGRGYIRKEAISAIKTIPKSKIVQKPVRAFNDHELQAIFASDLHENLKFCYRGLLFLGCRLGELKRIEWQHVDLSARTIRIYGEKTNQWRVVPICSALLPLMLAEYEQRHDGEAPVFRMEVGGAANKHLYDYLMRVCHRYGFKNVTLHSFRHTFVQRHLRAGVDFRTIMRWTGHKDLTSFAAYIAQFEAKASDIDRVDYSFLSDGSDGRGL